MKTTNKTEVTKDVSNKKITVLRNFSAPIEHVWKAWTTPELLDQWWAPKPYRAETKSMDFRPGGFWLYCMVGPDDSRMWARLDYKSIERLKNYEAVDAFCDEDGNKNSEFPSMQWRNDFRSTEDGTEVVVNIAFSSEADLNKILELGFEEGFTSALGNLDELLEN